MRGRRRAGLAGVAAVMMVVAALMAAAVLAVSARIAPARNVVPLVVGAGLGGFNRLLVSVMVCKPGTEDCATVDNVMVDTGSTGLRLDRTALPAAFDLPVFKGTGQRPLAECVNLGGSGAWGGLYRADLRMGGLTAPNLPIQLFEDASARRPGACPRPFASPPTSNGTLGVSAHLTDCLGICDQSVMVAIVYDCNGTACAPLPGKVDAANRLPNPVTRLDAGGVNGLIFDLPAPPPAGALSVTGTLTFGIENGQPGGARVIRLNDRGAFTTTYDGRDYPASYIDTGTGSYVLTDLGLPQCARSWWAFCADPPRALSAAITGLDGAPIPMRFRVGNFDAIRARGFAASDAVAELQRRDQSAFVWGAPFFMGRRVFLVPEGKTMPGSDAVGPFYAFVP